MIYRILIDQQTYVWHAATETGEWCPSGNRLMGAFSAGFSTGMGDLPFPKIDNRRARFFFTEAGWQRYGRHVASAAREAGHVVRVVRHKNPKPSQIVYRDPYQLALLPNQRLP